MTSRPLSSVQRELCSGPDASPPELDVPAPDLARAVALYFPLQYARGGLESLVPNGGLASTYVNRPWTRAGLRCTPTSPSPGSRSTT